MSLGLQIVAGWMGFVALFGLSLLAWAIYSGQFDDPEALKHIPFNEIEPLAWPDLPDTPKGA